MNEPPTHEVKLDRDVFAQASGLFAAKHGGIWLPRSLFKTRVRLSDRVRVVEVDENIKPTGMEFTGQVINIEWNDGVSVTRLKEGE